MWSNRGTGGKELTIMICMLVLFFLNRTFRTKTQGRQSLAFYTYTWSSSCAGATGNHGQRQQPTYFTTRYLHWARDLHPHRGHRTIHTTRYILPGLECWYYCWCIICCCWRSVQSPKLRNIHLQLTTLSYIGSHTAVSGSRLQSIYV